MTTRLTFLGHASFQLETAGQTILIDPFFTDNPAATTTADDVDADVILITHGHGDHVGDTVTIARRTGALVIANYEIVQWLGKQGVENAHPMHIGGSHSFDFGRVKLTIAHHGSELPDGSSGGNPAGIIIGTDAGNVYFAGDTGLFMDMQLIGDEGLAVAVVPIGDNFTMGPEDAVKAVSWLKPQTAIPCHFNTWPLIEQDATAWASAVDSETNSKAVVLSGGESLELGS